MHYRISCAEWNILHAWVADYFQHHHIVILSAVLKYNKLYKSKNCSSTFVYYLLSVKCNFVFTLRNSTLATTWPTGPSATALLLPWHHRTTHYFKCTKPSASPSIVPNKVPHKWLGVRDQKWLPLVYAHGWYEYWH